MELGKQHPSEDPAGTPPQQTWNPGPSPDAAPQQPYWNPPPQSQPGYPGGQGYPQPGAGYQQQNWGDGAPPYGTYHQPAQEQPSALVWVIIAWLTFWPLGIAALIQQMQVSSFWAAGRYQEAHESAGRARKYGKIALGIGIALFVFMFLFAFAIGISTTQSCTASPGMVTCR